MEKVEKYKPEHYENRELSWLKFNERILGEARDKENLLFERLKFLSITILHSMILINSIIFYQHIL